MTRVLWIPIFSMRSYETGEYSILKDGNFQLTLSRMIASDFDEIIMTRPTLVSDFEEFRELISRLPKLRDRLSFTPAEYGINAVETRQKFYEVNASVLSTLLNIVDYVVTDITGFYKLNSDKPYVNNFNITKLPHLQRDYIDQFFDEDVKSIEQSMLTTVINESQRNYIRLVKPDLAKKVLTYTMVANENLLPYPNDDEIFYPIENMSYDRTIFWPFRISDKAYKFQEFLKIFIENGLFRDFDLIISDPNDSYTENHSFIKKIKPTKQEYYKILAACPIIIMLDEMDDVLHPGTIEFFYYNCPIITFRNNIIDHANQILTMDEIPHVLRSLYFESKDICDFIYSPFEISDVYCKGYFAELAEAESLRRLKRSERNEN